MWMKLQPLFISRPDLHEKRSERLRYRIDSNQRISRDILHCIMQLTDDMYLKIPVFQHFCALNDYFQIVM